EEHEIGAGPATEQDDHGRHHGNEHHGRLLLGRWRTRPGFDFRFRRHAPKSPKCQTIPALLELIGREVTIGYEPHQGGTFCRAVFSTGDTRGHICRPRHTIQLIDYTCVSELAWFLHGKRRARWPGEVGRFGDLTGTAPWKMRNSSACRGR